MMMRSFLQKSGLQNISLPCKNIAEDLLVNGRHEIVLKTLQPSDVTMVIPPSGEHETVTPSEVPIDILYEDDYLLIINKPVGDGLIPSKLHPELSPWANVKGYYKRRGYADQNYHVVTRS